MTDSGSAPLPRKRRLAMLVDLLAARWARPRARTRPALVPANLPAVHGRLEIVRDARGIPHVYADDRRDLFTALGWLQGADRFFFIDAVRHLGAGRLCALVGDLPAPKRDPILGGKRLADVDGFVRPLGFEAQSRADFGRLAAEHAALLEAFADGVNAALRAMAGRYPPEYLVAGPVRPWHAADCLLAARACAFVISLTPFENELVFDAVRGRLGDDGARRLYPEAPWDAAPTSYRPRGEVPEPELPLQGVGGGSNNWAVAATRSESGAPLFGSDPHVPVVPLPTFWYHAHAEAPAWRAQGGLFPGCPVFGVGHNGHVAWGPTTGFRDGWDLYRIHRLPGDPARYRTAAGPAEITAHREELPARFGRRVTITWESCAHGILYPGWRHHDGVELAVRHVSSDLARWFEGCVALVGARTVEEHRRALAAMHEGPFDFNHVYAHRDGHIGWELYGRTPRRRRDGLFVRDADDPQGEWDGWIPFEDMPKQLAPERGFVATANSATDPQHTSVFTTVHCEPRYRTNRIEAVLGADRAHTLESFAALQADVVAAHIPPLRDAVVAMLDAAGGDDPEIERARAALRAWDGSFRVDSCGAALFGLLQHELPGRVFTPLLGPTLGRRYAAGRRALPRLHALLLDACDPLRTDIERAAGRPLAVLVRDTVKAVVRRLDRDQGPDPARWRWGAVHRVWLVAPLGFVPFVGAPFVALEGEFPGDEYTVSPSRAVPFRGRLYTLVGATSRFLCDLSRPDEALWAHSAGPSADPRTTYFAGLSPSWHRFEYFRSALWRAEEIPDPVERIVIERR